MPEYINVEGLRSFSTTLNSSYPREGPSVGTAASNSLVRRVVRESLSTDRSLSSTLDLPDALGPLSNIGLLKSSLVLLDSTPLPKE